MAKPKKGQSKGQPKAEDFFILNLRHIRANTFQRRKHGVLPNLNDVGYGLFEKLTGHESKMPLWEMLTSNKPELWALAVGLIDAHEPEIKELADSIAASTQLHNVGIVPVDESDRNNGYDVVYGMIRCLARAYNHGRSGGELPLTVKAEIAQDITDPNDSPAILNRWKESGVRYPSTPGMCAPITQIWFSIKKQREALPEGEQECEQIRTKTAVFEGSTEKAGARKPQKTRGKRKW